VTFVGKEKIGGCGKETLKLLMGEIEELLMSVQILDYLIVLKLLLSESSRETEVGSGRTMDL
jgi:hypothetical protein